jgi:hypothetical protein
MIGSCKQISQAGKVDILGERVVFQIWTFADMCAMLMLSSEREC